VTSLFLFALLGLATFGGMGKDQGQEGRGQEAEGRREKYGRGFDPAQFLATKSKMQGGERGPLLQIRRQKTRASAEGLILLPFALCIRAFLLTTTKEIFLRQSCHS
jgi:hypothetical protein